MTDSDGDGVLDYADEFPAPGMRNFHFAIDQTIADFTVDAWKVVRRAYRHESGNSQVV